MNGKYDEIMGLPHHVSKTRPQMPISDRAAQFAPFAADVYKRQSMTWDAAKSKFTRFKPFDDPLYRDLLELVFTHVREYFIVIDRDFIYEIGVLYLSIAAQAMIASLKNRFQEE